MTKDPTNVKNINRVTNLWLATDAKNLLWIAQNILLGQYSRLTTSRNINEIKNFGMLKIFLNKHIGGFHLVDFIITKLENDMIC